jgi:TRAP-type C4-dicarboxylate transport system permease small subunit
MKNDKLKLFLNNFEIYIATICFFILTVLLFFQAVSRYLFKYSLTWMEEFGTIMFVYMTYLGISGAITYRKHLRIDFLLDIMPFKLKRVFLILSNVVFAAFNVFISIVMFDLIKLMGRSVTTMLRIPRAAVYSIIPVALLFSVIRLAQDTIKLTKESAAELGVSKPALDLAACEREYREKLIAAQGTGGVA